MSPRCDVSPLTTMISAPSAKPHAAAARRARRAPAAIPATATAPPAPISTIGFSNTKQTSAIEPR